MFLTSCMHQFGWLTERGGNFLNLLKKEGGTQKGEVPSEKGMFQPWRKLWTYFSLSITDFWAVKCTLENISCLNLKNRPRYNLGQNICRYIHALAQIPFTTSEMELDYYHQKNNLRVALWLVERLRMVFKVLQKKLRFSPPCIQIKDTVIVLAET